MTVTSTLRRRLLRRVRWASRLTRSRPVQVPADVLGDLGGPVGAFGVRGSSEVGPVVVGDASDSAERVLVLVGHELSIAGWLTT